MSSVTFEVSRARAVSPSSFPLRSRAVFPGAAVSLRPRRRLGPVGGRDSRSPEPPAGASATCAEGVNPYRTLFEDSHDLIVATVQFVAARHRLTRDTTEELRSRVMVHLASNDFAVLRRWRHESRLQSYLVSVITNVFLDYRNQEWGKTKPPAAARRGGAAAMRLWHLTHRRRLSFDDAVSVLLAEGDSTPREALWALYSEFPRTRGRYFVDLAEVADREQAGAEADALVQQRDADALAARVDRALATALRGLEAEDRLILKLFFSDGLTRARIARMLRLEQQRLYPRFQRLLDRMSQVLVAHGVGPAEVRALIGAPTTRWPDTIRNAVAVCG